MVPHPRKSRSAPLWVITTRRGEQISGHSQSPALALCDFRPLVPERSLRWVGMETRDARGTTGTRAPGALEVRLVQLDRLDHADVQEWTALFDRQQGPANPFCSPLWVRAWLTRFVP